MDNTFFMPSVETLPGINAKKAKLQNSAPIKHPERPPDVEESPAPSDRESEANKEWRVRRDAGKPASAGRGDILKCGQEQSPRPEM